MSLADTLGVMTAASASIGGFTGLMVPFIDSRDWLDNGQRGFFVGAFFGAIGGFVIHGAIQLPGGA